MEINLRKYHIYIPVIILFFFTNHSYADQLDRLVKGHFEDISKTLYVIDHSFLKHSKDLLQLITLDNFQKTAPYAMLAGYASQYSLNINYRKELCEKSFAIKDKKENLIIQFQKNMHTNMWYIDDAHFLKKGKRVDIQMMGFSPLSYAQNFESLTQILHTKKIGQYLSLAPYGKLNQDFCKKNTLFITKTCKLIYINLLIYDQKESIIDLIFMSFQRFPAGYKDKQGYKSGWLLIDTGSMKTFYPTGENLLLDFLLGRVSKSKIRLKTPNNYFFTPNLTDETNSSPKKQ